MGQLAEGIWFILKTLISTAINKHTYLESQIFKPIKIFLFLTEQFIENLCMK